MSTEAPARDPLAPGTEVAGFRVERLIGRGTVGAVYEATQTGLDRRVALKLIARDRVPTQRVARLRWPEHPSVVGLYASGVCEHGSFVAMRLLPGGTLADRLGGRRRHRAELLQALTDVASALDAAHGAGIVHGSVAARNVLFDGHGGALLSDFGLGAPDATAEDDTIAFRALVRACLGDDAPDAADAAWTSAGEIIEAMGGTREPSPAPAAGRPRLPIVLAGLAAAAAAAAVLASALTGPDETRPSTALPPVITGAQALGSALPATRLATLDCDGGPITGAGPACTILQTQLPGRPLAAASSGAVRRWAVRGAKGALALQVLRRRGETFTEVVRGPYEHVADAGVHVFRTDLSLRRGDQIGLEVRSGGAIGVRTGVPGASTARWLGPLNFVPRGIDHGPGSGLDHELMLRVEFVAGATSRLPGALAGLRARLAPAGRVLAERPVELPGGDVGAVAVVRVGERIAIDLFKAGVRVARTPVADADARGRVGSLLVTGSRVPQLVWRNRDGGVVHHDYEVGPRSVLPRDRPPV